MKNKKYIRAALAFVGINLAAAFIGWASGYDFNQRNEIVGLFVAVILALSAGVSAMIINDY